MCEIKSCPFPPARAGLCQQHSRMRAEPGLFRLDVSRAIIHRESIADHEKSASSILRERARGARKKMGIMGIEEP